MAARNPVEIVLLDIYKRALGMLPDADATAPAAE
jgi:hypothetical protein